MLLVISISIYILLALTAYKEYVCQEQFDRFIDSVHHDIR